MTIGSIARPGDMALNPPAKGDTPEKVRGAAQQFESLLIGQLLKTSREAGQSGWLGTESDDAGQIGVEMAEQQFARMLSAGGGLGMAKMIAQGLNQSSNPAPSAKSTPPESGG